MCVTSHVRNSQCLMRNRTADMVCWCCCTHSVFWHCHLKGMCVSKLWSRVMTTGPSSSSSPVCHTHTHTHNTYTNTMRQSQPCIAATCLCCARLLACLAKQESACVCVCEYRRHMSLVGCGAGGWVTSCSAHLHQATLYLIGRLSYQG